MEKICRQYDVAWTPTIVQVPVSDVVFLEPAITGLEHVDQASTADSKKKGHGGFFSGFASDYRKRDTASSVTSVSSHSRDDHDENGPSAPPCAVATPL